MANVSQPLVSHKLLVRIGWVVMALGSLGAALSAVQYLSFSPAASRLPLSPTWTSHMVWLSLHAIPGGLTLLLGPVNFVTAIRQRYPVAHRLIGRIYLVCVLIGSIMGVISAVMSTSGLVAQLGFLLLAIAWFYSGLMAYRTIRRRQIQLHRVWMIRNYALSFSAVLLRIFLAAGIAYLPLNPSISFESVYTSSVWCSIVISYVVAEWFIVQRVRSPLAVNAGAPAQPLA